ncbi:uncharacterized protein BJ212DRAFT_1298860 [Suillus subaureus]|uniref:Uncharacterized protein n=1 Tax=Suillus subaureus TaxID=48587 RepID=A0A9P7JEP7_9AGAM|nr:uncharacterized protein BJ212DRAFT_1298860 [Suillus subaureus]KAG1817991.1 hypothetical protein BJ212DRAFT_1298860 [Suillus subaureus]
MSTRDVPMGWRTRPCSRLGRNVKLVLSSTVLSTTIVYFRFAIRKTLFAVADQPEYVVQMSAVGSIGTSRAPEGNMLGIWCMRMTSTYLWITLNIDPERETQELCEEPFDSIYCLKYAGKLGLLTLFAASQVITTPFYFPVTKSQMGQAEDVTGIDGILLFAATRIVRIFDEHSDSTIVETP